MELNPTLTTYNNLLLAYRFMNDKLFDGILPPCLITLQREKKTFGYFCRNRFVHSKDDNHNTDEIALNPQYFRSPGRDDRTVVSTLVHEMCHLWQHHYGKPGRTRYHNREWAEQMKTIGLQPSDTGEEGGKETGDCMTHLIIEGGMFSVAFNELRGKGFVLEWIEFPRNPDPFEVPVTGGGMEDISGPTTLSDPDLPLSPTQPKKDTSKMKFTCPECCQNAWAKIGANLVCGICEVRMEYEDFN